jgi:integrase
VVGTTEGARNHRLNLAAYRLDQRVGAVMVSEGTVSDGERLLRFARSVGRLSSQERRRRTKGRRFPPEVLTEDEARRLIRAASNRAPTGQRNRALLVVLYRGGLRLGEALAQRPADVDARAVRFGCSTGRAIAPAWSGSTQRRWRWASAGWSGGVGWASAPGRCTAP